MNTTLESGPAAALWSRRNALRLAAVTIPALTAVAAPTLSGVAGAASYAKPGAGNTGVQAGVKLTRVNGNITVTTPGTVISNKDIYGRVLIRAANVVVRNCRIRGTGSPTSNTGLVDCNHPNVRNALIEHCLLTPDRPTVWLDAVIGKEYTAKWNNVYGVVDGFGVYNASNRSAPTNVRIESNYVHDLSYFSKDPNHGNGPTHNDGIQVQGGSNIQIVGNNIQCFMSTTAGTHNYPARNIGQGILIQPNLAPVTNSSVSYNWLDGGKVSIYFVRGKYSSMRFGACTGNRFGTNQYKFGGSSQYQIRIQTGVSFTTSLSGNVWDANGKSMTVGTTGGIRYDK